MIAASRFYTLVCWFLMYMMREYEFGEAPTSDLHN